MGLSSHGCSETVKEKYVYSLKDGDLKSRWHHLPYPAPTTFSLYCDSSRLSCLRFKYSLLLPSPWSETLRSSVHIPPFMCLGTPQDFCCDTLPFWRALALGTILITL